MLWILLACALDGGKNAGDTRIWTGTWADHLVYREVDAATLLGSGADTAASPDTRMDAVLAEEGGDRTLAIRALDDVGVGDTLREVTFTVKGGLSVTKVDGAVLDPAVVLLPEQWEEGEAVTSGSYTATTDPLADGVTWYGTFDDVVTVRVTGPAGDPLVGVLRFAPDVGLVQFALGDVAGDLVWYDPPAAAAE